MGAGHNFCTMPQRLETTMASPTVMFDLDPTDPIPVEASSAVTAGESLDASSAFDPAAFDTEDEVRDVIGMWFSAAQLQ